VHALLLVEVEPLAIVAADTLAGDDLRSNRLDHSFRAPRARLLLIAAALCGFDLSSGSIARQPPKPGSHFLKA